MFLSVAYAQVADSPASAHGGSSFPPFDSSFFASHLFWLFVCFGVFYYIVARFLVPQIGGVIETRRERIATDLTQAAEMKTQADDAVAAYEAALAEARQSAAIIAQKASDEARAKAEKERKAAEKALEKKLGEAESQIYNMRDAALRDVGLIAEETAGEIIHHLIGGSVEVARIAHAVMQAGQIN